MKQHDSTGRVSAFFGANTQVPILNELLATMWMKGGSVAWRPSRKLLVDEATRFDGTCVSLRCEHTGSNFKRTSCDHVDERRVYCLAPLPDDTPLSEHGFRQGTKAACR